MWDWLIGPRGPDAYYLDAVPLLAVYAGFGLLDVLQKATPIHRRLEMVLFKTWWSVSWGLLALAVYPWISHNGETWVLERWTVRPADGLEWAWFYLFPVVVWITIPFLYNRSFAAQAGARIGDGREPVSPF